MLKLKGILTIILISGFLSIGAAFAKIYDFTEGNKITLLEDARASVAYKIKLVKEARHHIHIMSYYWDNNNYPIELMTELNLAHARGVDVRIISTLIPSLTMDLFGKSTKALFKDLKKHNTKAVMAYMKFSPRQNHSLVENIHEKIFLVDSNVAILGGRNVSDNDFRAKDMEVSLMGPVVNQVQTHFEKMFSYMVDLHVYNKCGTYQDPDQAEVCTNELLNTKYTKDNALFYPAQPVLENGSRARILTNDVLFNNFKSTYFSDERFLIKDDIIDTVIKINFTKLRAYNYFILPTERYKLYLEKNLAEGKSIDIFTNSKITAAAISDNGYVYGLPEMHNLVSRGLNLYQWQGSKSEIEVEDQHFYLHEKVMIFDNDHAIIGSHNFGSGSTSVSSEISVEFFSEPEVKKLIDVFDAEKSNSEVGQLSTLPFLENEINQNEKRIKFLHLPFVRNILKELY